MEAITMAETISTIPAATPSSVPNTPGTPTPSQVPVTPGTPTQPQVDVERIKAEYDAQIRQKENDLRQMKASLQKGEAQRLRAEESKRQELEREVEQYRISTMDENERALYERETLQSRAQELEQSFKDAQAQLDERDTFLRTYVYF